MDKIAERMKAARALMALLMAIAKMIMKAIRRLFGIVDEGADLISADIRAAWKGFRTVDEGVGRGLDATIGKPRLALARTAGGAAVGAAGFVGRVLCGLLPQRPASPSQLAAQVAAADTARTQSSAPAYSVAAPSVTLADLPVHRLLQKHAGTCADLSGKKLAALREKAPLPAHLAGWLETLDVHQQVRLVTASPEQVERHLAARTDADLIPGVPRCPRSTDHQARLRQALASMRVQPAAAAALPRAVEETPGPGRHCAGLEDVDLGAYAR
ncbi:hypothetical protein [Methylobacterium ajmalii]|jgi:hypothetical protein|uniref:Uncharacterized protein n=2 Tax=Methylobacterium currus TaxID=2051553 RepID=A0A2R4WLX2_9HYPH|nr:hypothetical protein [Methylobacterium ajmalii]AWB22551.1 hypothetical protein DA075_17905 [Methylobacterium currus]MBZ6411109.1 hypothetical protein [Methylobacterium sp.]MBK3397100.1 hypothetical protein [Methylobacterium ajmalii]MBK3408315.1 hypothetical protein [Methylobacterium ajmalii]MBK3421130.1 hypothetical protein [Methylobacterium ajmalii]